MILNNELNKAEVFCSYVLRVFKGKQKGNFTESGKSNECNSLQRVRKRKEWKRERAVSGPKHS